jgi:hypothetical protein
VRPASDRLNATRKEVETLLARVDKVRKGFELLPQELTPDTTTKKTSGKK